MEFMRQRNMRLVDLFQSLDTDGSKSLTRDEFREGLLVRTTSMYINMMTCHNKERLQGCKKRNIHYEV